MQQALRRSSLVPGGFVVESAFCEADKAVITVRASSGFGLCPSCGMVSTRVHSHYRRRVTDLPLSGRIVRLVLIARRFRCDAVLCGRQIFTERFRKGHWLHGRDARPGSIALSTTSVWRSVADRRRASQND
jgi:transposase